MPNPHIAGSFPDLTEVTATFTDIFNERFKSEGDRVGDYYRKVNSSKINSRYSTVSGMGQLVEFTGQLNYGDVAQGYDVTITPVQFNRAFSIERLLADTDQTDIMNSKPRALGTAAARTRNYHAVRPFDNAFTTDSLFASHSEGVPMCSNSHTTTTGASTTTGYDNLTTSAISSVAVSTMRVQALNFRDEQAEKITNHQFDTILIPQQGSIEETAWEIINSMGKVDVATNNANFNKDRWTLKTEIYLSDANNFFMYDSTMMKDNGLIWQEATPPEFAMVEDFDTLIAKWRCYGRWGNHWISWPWIIGAQVS
jgi:hypothetical protein